MFGRMEERVQVERGEELRRRGMGKKHWEVGGWRILDGEGENDLE